MDRTLDPGGNLGGAFTFPGTAMTVNRMGYGAMQLAGPQVFGPPRDIDAAVAVLREAVASGVNHIDTSDYCGPPRQSPKPGPGSARYRQLSRDGIDSRSQRGHDRRAGLGAGRPQATGA